MAHMETKSFACDIGVLVGHAPVRTWVMGAKANASDIPGGRESAPLNDEDIAPQIRARPMSPRVHGWL